MQLEACAHPFFDELREPNARLPNGRPLPPLFNFKQEVRSPFFLNMFFCVRARVCIGGERERERIILLGLLCEFILTLFFLHFYVHGMYVILLLI